MASPQGLKEANADARRAQKALRRQEPLEQVAAQS